MMNTTYATANTMTPAASHTVTTGNAVTTVHSVPSNAINNSPSNGLVIGLVVAAIVMLAVVAPGLVLFKRKRRRRVSETEISTWHDDTADVAEIEEDTSDDREIRVDDVELQPTFSIGGHHLMMDDETLDNADNGGCNDVVKRDTQQSIKKKQVNDRESVVFDSKSKSLKVRDNVTQSQNDTLDENGKQVERYQKGGEEYTFVDKISKAENGSKTINAPNNELATAVIWEDDHMYVNYESIRLNENWKRNKSMVLTMDHEVETNSSPRRIASEKIRNIAGGAVRPIKRPMPQPRLSKKKEIDPYDYLPGYPISEISPVNTDIVDNVVDDQDTIYAYPRNNEAVCDGNVEEEQDEIYKYPTNNGTVCDGSVEKEQDEDRIYAVPRSNAIDS